jgi:hypothetical protein
MASWAILPILYIYLCFLVITVLVSFTASLNRRHMSVLKVWNYRHTLQYKTYCRVNQESSNCWCIKHFWKYFTKFSFIF